MIRVLITGINGQVGSSLVREAQKLGHEVVAISRKEWDMARSPEQGEDVVIKAKPDLVINPAAYTKVDDAEDDQPTAFNVNARAPQALAKGCSRLDIPLFHVSTDYVFNGAKQGPYVETDQPDPINIYGYTKLAGELAVQHESKKFIILRTSWVFSKDGSNFVNTVLRLANESHELRVVNDQFGGPTSADGIAELLLQLATDHQDKWGIYHYSGQPFVSWHAFAVTILKTQLNEVNHKKINVQPITTDLNTSKVKRPKNSKLCSTKIIKTFNIKPQQWEKYL